MSSLPVDAGDEAEAGLSENEEVKTHRRPPGVVNCRMSPLDIRFSQMRARTEFRDGKLLADTVPLIRTILLSEEAPASGEKVWLLEAPFPAIEILKWRCKLRDAQTGRPKIDPVTGAELWDSEDHFFTLDNRRLYCLQKAALSVWPDRAVVDMAELPPGPLARFRELKKFRTLNRGKGIHIGGRNDGETLVKWSWQHEAGCPEESEDDVADAGNSHVQMRRRPRPEWRGPKGRRGSAGARNSGNDATGVLGGVRRFCSKPWASGAILIMIYASVRIAWRLSPWLRETIGSWKLRIL